MNYATDDDHWYFELFQLEDHMSYVILLNIETKKVIWANAIVYYSWNPWLFNIIDGSELRGSSKTEFWSGHWSEIGYM